MKYKLGIMAGRISIASLAAYFENKQASWQKKNISDF